MIAGIITYLLLRLTWHEVPEVKSLITLKRTIVNLLLSTFDFHKSYFEIFFSDS